MRRNRDMIYTCIGNYIIVNYSGVIITKT